MCRFFLCFALLFYSWFLLFLCFRLGFLLVTSESYFGFKCGVPFKIFMLCVVCVMIAIVVGSDIGAHDNKNWNVDV